MAQSMIVVKILCYRGLYLSCAEHLLVEQVQADSDVFWVFRFWLSDQSFNEFFYAVLKWLHRLCFCAMGHASYLTRR